MRRAKGKGKGREEGEGEKRGCDRYTTTSPEAKSSL